MPVNPAAAVRGPRYIVRRGKTSVLDPAGARQLIDAINTSTVIGLCDRAFVGLMVYSFARIDAAIGLRVEAVYTQDEMRRPTIAYAHKGLPVQCLSKQDFLFPDVDEKYVPEVLAYIHNHDFKTFNTL